MDPNPPLRPTLSRLFLAALLSTPLAPAPAPGQTEGPTAADDARPGRDAARLEAFLRRFPASDGNGDGVLTREEVRAFNTKRRQAQERTQGDGRGQQAAEARAAGRAPTHADVRYGDHPKQAFDIWLAQRDDGVPSPLCIYIHGGGFRGGDKRLGGRLSPAAFLQAGISFASMNYRLTEGGTHPYPTAMHDAARGLQFIRGRAADWNLDPERVACFGGSAGAGISLWLAFHDDLAEPGADDPVARQSTRIVAAGCTGGQSTYDLRTFREWFGVPDLPPHPALAPFYKIESEADWESARVKQLMADASPITHLTEDDAPVAVHMSYNRGDVPVEKSTNPGVWVHHVRLGLKLQEAMAKLGLECVVTSPDHKDTSYAGLSDFLIRKLTAENPD